MRTTLTITAMVALAGCATTNAVCPPRTRLVTEDRPTGRVEACATTTAGVTAMPAPGRTHEGMLGMARPPSTLSGVHGPYTRWYPSGAIESHGRFVVDGARSVPDGVWGFWYEDGSRKTVARFDRGRAIGCVAIWDEQRNEITGIVENDHIRVDTCAPPEADELVAIEERSHPRWRRDQWGDVALNAHALGGTFGARSQAQDVRDPDVRFAVQGTVRKHLGSIRLGPALGMRFAEAGHRAYLVGAVGAYSIPLPSRRLGLEVETQLSLQYLAIEAERGDMGRADVGIWSPLLAGRLTSSFAVTPVVSLVASASVDGWYAHDSEQTVRYCTPFCRPAVSETWTLGGFSYGASIGLRLTVR